MGAAVADDGFDFRPGAQVPLLGGGGQTAATNALASAAYRDGGKDSKLDKILTANNENHPATVKPPKISLFEPSLGEAFCRAVEARTLGAGRKPLIQSFGADPQTVVEHCLAASHIRKERDRKLRLIMLVCGVLFLPGLLLWLGLFQLRKSLASKEGRGSWLGTVLLVGIALVVAALMFKLPLTGFLGLYARAMIIAPALGWLLARRACEATARDLRSRWDGLLSGGGVGAKIPEAVPGNPDEKAREDLRHQLAKLTAEDRSNQVFYAGPKGILGMGTRWGSWQMAEELAPKSEGMEIHPFRSWDVIRGIDAQLRKLERGPLHTGGFPPAAIQHWIVTPIGEGAAEVARPTGENVDAFLIKPHEITRICNEQQFSAGNRHYLGIQYPLWDGQLVINMLVTVTVLYKTLRVDVTAHALGPRARAVHVQVRGPGGGGTQEHPLLGDRGAPAAAGGRAGGGAPRGAGPADLVPAAPGLLRRQAGPARAVRPASRLGELDVAAPVHGGRRPAHGGPGPAVDPRGDLQGAGGERRRHGPLHEPLLDHERAHPGARSAQG